MSVTPQMVKELRERTGAGMMDCKNALLETKGDMEQAIVILRKRGMASAAKKAARVTSEGSVASYIHAGGKIGVLVEVNCESDFVGRGEDFQNFVKEVAMQICAANPQYLKREDVPAVAIEKEREIYKAQVMEQGKPANVADKIVEGKLNKWFAEVCLMEQPWVREPKMKVEDLRAQVVQKTGENVQVRRFTRFVLGEGIEKKQENLAEEIAKMHAAVQAKS